MVGIEAALGRTFAGNEGLVIGDGPVAMLSHRLWQSRFGANPEVIGRAVSVSGRPFTIISVAPREFAGTQRGSVPDLYVPMTLFGELTARKPDALANQSEPLHDHGLDFRHLRLREGAQSSKKLGGGNGEHSLDVEHTRRQEWNVQFDLELRPAFLSRVGDASISA